MAEICKNKPLATVYSASLSVGTFIADAVGVITCMLIEIIVAHIVRLSCYENFGGIIGSTVHSRVIVKCALSMYKLGGHKIYIIIYYYYS